MYLLFLSSNGSEFSTDAQWVRQVLHPLSSASSPSQNTFFVKVRSGATQYWLILLSKVCYKLRPLNFLSQLSCSRFFFCFKVVKHSANVVIFPFQIQFQKEEWEIRTLQLSRKNPPLQAVLLRRKPRMIVGGRPRVLRTWAMSPWMKWASHSGYEHWPRSSLWALLWGASEKGPHPKCTWPHLCLTQGLKRRFLTTPSSYTSRAAMLGLPTSLGSFSPHTC